MAEIITNISLSKDRYSDNIVINMKRNFPSQYSEDDQFTLEKYELDLNDIEIRNELQNAIKSQTVFQYMMDDLFMSSSFFIVPVNFTGASTEREYLERYANFSQLPLFIDISSTVKAQNNFYVDKHSFKNMFLYLYRIVYRYDGIVYNTNYVAGFEAIESGALQEGQYKRMILNQTMSELFGPNWANLKHYFTTEAREKRTQYRQTPSVFHLPMRKVNHRKQGPLEDYKIILNYREATRGINDIVRISNIVKSALEKQTKIFSELNRDNIDFTSSFGKDINKFVEDIETIGSNTIFSIVEKNVSVFRVLSKSLIGKDQYNIPDFMVKEGIYILLSSTEEAETIYNYLTTIDPENVYGLIEDIYIADILNKSILYTISAGK